MLRRNERVRIRMPRCSKFNVLEPFVGVVIWRSEDGSVAAVAKKRDPRTGRRDVFLYDFTYEGR